MNAIVAQALSWNINYHFSYESVTSDLGTETAARAISGTGCLRRMMPTDANGTRYMIRTA